MNNENNALDREEFCLVHETNIRSLNSILDSGIKSQYQTGNRACHLSNPAFIYFFILREKDLFSYNKPIIHISLHYLKRNISQFIAYEKTDFKGKEIKKFLKENNIKYINKKKGLEDNIPNQIMSIKPVPVNAITFLIVSPSIYESVKEIASSNFKIKLSENYQRDIFDSKKVFERSNQ